jgi:hypothetical protein
VVANNPKFDDSIFVVEFPAGYTVQDKIRGTVYRISPAAADIQRELRFDHE